MGCKIFTFKTELLNQRTNQGTGNLGQVKEILIMKLCHQTCLHIAIHTISTVESELLIWPTKIEPLEFMPPTLPSRITLTHSVWESMPCLHLQTFPVVTECGGAHGHLVPGHSLTLELTGGDPVRPAHLHAGSQWEGYIWVCLTGFHRWCKVYAISDF